MTKLTLSNKERWFKSVIREDVEYEYGNSLTFEDVKAIAFSYGMIAVRCDDRDRSFRITYIQPSMQDAVAVLQEYQIASQLIAWLQENEVDISSVDSTELAIQYSTMASGRGASAVQFLREFLHE
ncbi:hypothetical protein [Chroococcidiopsis sp.]|uniref:hypothetical protein n=1 Tax=Chroococcidiopsis sp. TaxID=3088168 RepID=UPI003F332D4E